MFNRLQLKQVFHQLLVLCGVLLLSRFTKNWGFLFVSLYGVTCCMDRKIGQALVIFLLISFLPMVNPFLMPRYGQFAMMARLSSLIMALALLVSGVSRPGPHRLPVDILFVYLLLSSFTSLQGYAPLTSELKIINFIFFLLSIALGTRNLHRNPRDILLLRNSFLALCVFIVYGSLLTLPFPHIAYLTSFRSTLVNYGLDYVYDVAAKRGGLLFCGTTVHSQFLGPMTACCFGWILCDMWLVEKRWNPLHVALMLPIPVIAYMTRARIALFTLTVAIVAPLLLCLPNTRISRRTRNRFYLAVVFCLVALLTAAIGSEINNHAISKWIRKTEDVSSDDRTLGDALTGSRQGAIAENMADFRRNRLLGSGFQVDRKMAGSQKRASFFSAPIEKGLLPLMVLGESGLIGTAIFLLFLISFFSICQARRYTATSALLIVFLATNMAEATFFSPSGAGGVFWILLVVGGFTIDMAVVADRQAAFASREGPPAPPAPLPVDAEDSDAPPDESPTFETHLIEDV